MKRDKDYAKTLFKYIKKLAKLNPDVPFLFNMDKHMVVGDISNEELAKKYSDGDCLKRPEDGYNYIYTIPDAKNVSVPILGVYEDGYREPLAYLSTDNVQEKQNLYENYTGYDTKMNSIGRKLTDLKCKIKDLHLGERIKNNNIGNRFKYLFSKRSKDTSVIDKLGIQSKSTETKNKKPVPVEETKPVIKDITAPVNQPNQLIPVDEPVVTPVNRYAELEKAYELANKEAYLKLLEQQKELGLDEYEIAFIDDAKAECLEPTDPEFNMMLNERTVNKEKILAYYSLFDNYNSKLEDNKTKLEKSKFEHDSDVNKIAIQLLFLDLDEYEKMFVIDAIAENLGAEDPEFGMMLGERTVNKNKVTEFMKAYKKYFEVQKEINKEYAKYCDLENVDYSLLTINELRKAASENRGKLTGAELEQFKASKLKKAELVEIMNRIQTNKNEEIVVKALA